MRKNKYRNQKVERDGAVFDSIKEYRRFCELSMLERAGQITDLQRQVGFELISAQREPDTTGKRGGVRRGKVIEHAVKYVADFVYWQGSHCIVEDTKGMKTKDYIIKRKLMLYVHHIRIREV